MTISNSFSVPAAAYFILILSTCSLISIKAAENNSVPCTKRSANCSYCTLGEWTTLHGFWSTRCEWCAKSLKCHAPNDSENQCGNDASITTVAACPSEHRVQYNSKRGKKAFLLAGSAYEEGACLESCVREFEGGSYRLLKQVKFPCASVLHSGYECFAYVAMSDAERHVVVSYRGTSEAAQLFSEGESCVLKTHVEAPTGGQVYEYFYAGVNESYARIAPEIRPFVLQSYTLWSVGHSLGGAFATVFMSFVAQEAWINKNDTHLITMGSPRVGNWDFARRLEFHFPNIYRLVHHRDMVVNVPPQMNLWGPHLKALTSYALHSSIKLDKPFHAGIVIYYDNNMENAEDYKVCAQEDAKECSVLLQTSVQDHLMYFNTQVSKVCNCTNIQPYDMKSKTVSENIQAEL